MFAFLLGLCALLIAGCAAFFSVQGIATLFAGKYLAVSIMAGGLELGKLFAASFLHRYWKETAFLLKFYLILAVIALMGITSLGIFGFLSSAYQENHVKTEILDVKREANSSEKKLLENEMAMIQERISVLNEIRKTQEKRVEESGNYKVPREQAYEAIKIANDEIVELQGKITPIFEKIKNLEQDSLQIKMEESKSSDIGTLKYISKLFNTDVDSIVKWFTLCLVFVFDPLAVALILAYNVTVLKNKNYKTNVKESKNEEDFKKEIEEIFKKTIIEKDSKLPKYRKKE
jgi:hypothetical protein